MRHVSWRRQRRPVRCGMAGHERLPGGCPARPRTLNDSNMGYTMPTRKAAILWRQRRAGKPGG